MRVADTTVEATMHFWDDVFGLLTDKDGPYQRTPQQASQGITTYKQDVLQRRGVHKIPDAVYNQGEEQTAEIINGVIENGLPNSR